jgi:hypothetical protein
MAGKAERCQCEQQGLSDLRSTNFVDPSAPLRRAVPCRRQVSAAQRQSALSGVLEPILLVSFFITTRSPNKTQWGLRSPFTLHPHLLRRIKQKPGTTFGNVNAVIRDI